MGIFLDTLFMIACSKATLIIFLIIYAGFVIADLFKRHLLSNGFIYYFTVLLSPFAVTTAICSFMYSLVDRNSSWVIILTFLGSALLTALAAAVYIRGHIKPVDKTSRQLEYASPEQVNISALKRLVITGTVGMVIFGIIALYALAMAIEYLIVFTFAVPFIIGTIICLLIPGINLFAAMALLAIGIAAGEVIAVVCATITMVMLMSFLVTNGCIRYILTTNKTKGQKALFIFLSFIPIYNVIYGIHSLLKTNEN